MFSVIGSDEKSDCNPPKMEKGYNHENKSDYPCHALALTK